MVTPYQDVLNRIGDKRALLSALKALKGLKRVYATLLVDTLEEHWQSQARLSMEEIYLRKTSLILLKERLI